MPVIVVTRLRLKDPAVFDEFFASAVAVVEQAQNSEGALWRGRRWPSEQCPWTRTVWQARPEARSPKRAASAHDEPH